MAIPTYMSTFEAQWPKIRKKLLEKGLQEAKLNAIEQMFLKGESGKIANFISDIDSEVFAFLAKKAKGYTMYSIAIDLYNHAGRKKDLEDLAFLCIDLLQKKVREDWLTAIRGLWTLLNEDYKFSNGEIDDIDAVIESLSTENKFERVVRENLRDISNLA